ncbi:MAG: hypothetical protein M5U01_09395 [Ardenticatenaceae bacterium]|nr:hypothetical protein [Ardenticatenaceae bacterium]
MKYKHYFAMLVTLAIVALAGCQEVTLGTTNFTGPLNLTEGGSVSAPAVTLAGDADTGLYQSAANQLAVSAAGSQQLLLSAAGVTAPTGLTVSSGSVDFPAGAVAWADVSKSGASLADLATRSAGDLSSGTLPDARLSGNVLLFGGDTHTVCASGCDYTGVTAAVTAAGAGDLIVIGPGTYATESVSIGQNLALVGVGNPSLTGGDANGYVIRVTAGTVWLQNFTIDADASTTNQNHAVQPTGGTLILRGMDLSGGATDGFDAGAGLIVSGAGTTVSVYDSTLTSKDSATGALQMSAGTVRVWGSSLLNDTGGPTVAGQPAIVTGGTLTIYGSLLRGGTDNLGAADTSALKVQGGTVTVYGSSLEDGPSLEAFGLELSGGTATFYHSSLLGEAVAATVSGGTANFYNSYVKAEGTNQPAIDVTNSAGTVNAYNSVLIGNGTATGAVMCVTGTTVSVALSASNLTAMTEATDCTNDVGTPGNVNDAQVN